MRAISGQTDTGIDWYIDIGFDAGKLVLTVVGYGTPSVALTRGQVIDLITVLEAFQEEMR